MKFTSTIQHFLFTFISKQDCRNLERTKLEWNLTAHPSCQCSQNVDVNGPHHRCFELIVSSSFNQPMSVERERSHELVGSTVGAVYVHVLRTLRHASSFKKSTPNPFHFGSYWTSVQPRKIPNISFRSSNLCVLLIQIMVYSLCNGWRQ